MTLLQEVRLCPKIDLGCHVLVSVVKNYGMSEFVLLMYRHVICLQALAKIVKKLREWLSSTKIRNSNNANQTAHGPQKHMVACRIQSLYFPITDHAYI